MKISGWILNNRLMNLLYGEENDSQTRTNKAHGILIFALYILAFVLGLYFHEYNQNKTEWRRMTIEDHESYQKAIKLWYEQLDTTRTKP